MIRHTAIHMNKFVTEIKVEFGDAVFTIYKRLKEYIEDSESPIPLDVVNTICHRHTFYEMHFVLNGEMTCFFRDGKITLKKGHFICVPPETAHYTELSGEEAERETICFNISKAHGDSGFYDTYCRSLGEICVGEQEASPALMSAAAAFNNMKTPYTMREYCRQKLIGYELVYRMFPDLDSAPENNVRADPDAMYGLDEMVYDIRIPLGKIAENLGYSVRHTDRIIKKRYGETLSEIRAQQMLEAAKKLIGDDPGSPLGELLERTGFPSASSLYNAFVRHEKCTLTEYRNKTRDKLRK